MKFALQGNNVMIAESEKELRTAGGLYIPESTQKFTLGPNVDIGTVTDIAEGAEFAGTPFKVGDKVLFDKSLGYTLTLDSKVYRITTTFDIISVIHGDSDIKE